MNSNLESDWTQPNPVAKTTHCTHGLQTLSLGLRGVECENSCHNENFHLHQGIIHAGFFVWWQWGCVGDSLPSRSQF